MEKLTMDEFESRYTPTEEVVSLSNEYENRDGCFDITDEDLSILKTINIKRIWTQTDNEDGEVCYKAGFHNNPIMYFVAEEEWENKEEEYIVIYD